MSINRGKKSVVLDLRSNEGKKILKKILEQSDVLVENYRPGVMEKIGIDYKEAIRINPAIIYASVSGFGQTGPYKDKGAFDMIIQGYGGIMSITGQTEGEPVRVGCSIADLVAGYYTVIGILAALHDRSKNGTGQYIDISMLDCQLALLENAVARYFATDTIPKPLGSRHPSLAPFQTYEAKNGYFNLCVGNDRQFKSMCQAIVHDGLADDQRFINNPKRVEHINELNAILQAIFITQDTKYWLELFDSNDIPVGPLYNIAEIANDPHVNSRDMLIELDHPVAGKNIFANCPIKSTRLSGETNTKLRAAPTLGQHTEAVLRELSISMEGNHHER